MSTIWIILLSVFILIFWFAWGLAEFKYGKYLFRRKVSILECEGNRCIIQVNTRRWWFFVTKEYVTEDCYLSHYFNINGAPHENYLGGKPALFDTKNLNNVIKIAGIYTGLYNARDIEFESNGIKVIENSPLLWSSNEKNFKQALRDKLKAERVMNAIINGKREMLSDHLKET